MAVSDGSTELVRASAAGARFAIRAKLRAPRSGIVGERQGELVVAVSAPPVDGAANEEITATVAAALHVARGSVAIVSGAKSKSKVIEVSGLSVDEVRARLGRLGAT
jgi:uncharacterized protein (TIGR00251 family)